MNQSATPREQPISQWGVLVYKATKSPLIAKTVYFRYYANIGTLLSIPVTAGIIKKNCKLINITWNVYSN